MTSSEDKPCETCQCCAGEWKYCPYCGKRLARPAPWYPVWPNPYPWGPYWYTVTYAVPTTGTTEFSHDKT